MKAIIVRIFESVKFVSLLFSLFLYLSYSLSLPIVLPLSELLYGIKSVSNWSPLDPARLIHTNLKVYRHARES